MTIFFIFFLGWVKTNLDSQLVADNEINIRKYTCSGLYSFKIVDPKLQMTVFQIQ